MAATPSITIEPGGPVVQAKVGRKLLDEEACNELLAQLVPLAKERNQAVALDLSDVKYAASMALGALMNLHKNLAGLGQKLVLVNVQPTVQQVFRLTHMDKVFVTAATMDEAIQKLAPTPA